VVDVVAGGIDINRTVVIEEGRILALGDARN
jgi:hypothetical protein